MAPRCEIPHHDEFPNYRQIRSRFAVGKCLFARIAALDLARQANDIMAGLADIRNDLRALLRLSPE